MRWTFRAKYSNPTAFRSNVRCQLRPYIGRGDEYSYISIGTYGLDRTMNFTLLAVTHINFSTVVRRCREKEARLILDRRSVRLQRNKREKNDFSQENPKRYHRRGSNSRPRKTISSAWSLDHRGTKKGYAK